MFGIMKPEGGCAHKKHPDYQFHRMHYCGVCKAMGKSYGHKTRMLLNYDVVFLAELLSAISNQNLSQWGNAYQAINKCFTMPKAETPLSLQFAADANLLLSDLKVQDHVQDTRRLSWRFASWWYAKPFLKARQQLLKWGTPMEEIQQWADLQIEREKLQAEASQDLQSYIHLLAEPTAMLSSLIFRQGAVAVGQPQAAAAMADIGWNFGYLAYLLDAFEDVEKDAYSGQFNPLLLYYNKEKTLAEAELEEVRKQLLQTVDNISQCLAQLNLSEDKLADYQRQLRANITLQLYKDRVIPLRFREQLAVRWKNARQTAYEWTCESTSWTRQLRYQFLSVALFVAPQTPAYMGMGQKEAAVFTWAAFLSAFLAAIGLGVVVGRGRKKKKKNKRRQKRTARQFFKKLKRRFAGRADCWEECFAACCVACACGCCESCCESGCNNCCQQIANGDGNGWLWVLLAIGILVIGGIVLLIIIL